MKTTDALAFYYVGFAIPLFLMWASFADVVGGDTTPSTRSRYRRVATGFAVLGLAHPGFAFTAFDMARQLSRADWYDEPGARTTAQRAGWAVAVSLAIATVVVLVSVAK